MIPFIGTNNTYDDHTEWYCLRCYNKKFGEGTVVDYYGLTPSD